MTDRRGYRPRCYCRSRLLAAAALTLLLRHVRAFGVAPPRPTRTSARPKTAAAPTSPPRVPRVSQHVLVLRMRQEGAEEDTDVPEEESSPPLSQSPQDGGGPAYPQQTPHSGRHFLPSHPAYHHRRQRERKRDRIRRWARLGLGLSFGGGGARGARRTKSRRFMEGWYYRLTLPPSQGDASFAFIFSIDDPVGSGGTGGTDLSLAAAQVMGPGDGYIVQADRDDTKFWAWEASQGLGCTFGWKDDGDEGGDEDGDRNAMTTALHPDEWRRRVRTGFQVLPNSLQGRLVGRDGTERDAVVLGGPRDDTRSGDAKSTPAPAVCDFDMSIRPLSGWGDDGSDARQQRSTAGWLASFAVFEPHWQVTLADARATGTVNWNGTRYDFVDAPFYAEKVRYRVAPRPNDCHWCRTGSWLFSFFV